MALVGEHVSGIGRGTDALTSIDSWIEPERMTEPRWPVINAQISILKSLVISLDEARMFYSDAVRNVTHPYLKQCFERIIHTHLTIADDLADRIDGMGGSVARDGSCMTALHLGWAAWRVRISHDAETAYAKEAGKRETRVRRGFRVAGRCTPDACPCRPRIDSAGGTASPLIVCSGFTRSGCNRFHGKVDAYGKDHIAESDRRHRWGAAFPPSRSIIVLESRRPRAIRASCALRGYGHFEGQARHGAH